MPILKTYSGDTADNIVLVTGEQADDKPFFAYVLIKPSKMKEFEDAQKNPPYRVQDYGQILLWGESSEPPQGIEEMIMEKLVKPAEAALKKNKPDLFEKLKKKFSN